MMKAGVDYIGVGVGALIFNDQGKFLVTLRGPAAKNEVGKWEIPGGAVDFGETFVEAIKREVKEELAIEIDVGEMLTLCDHILPEEKQHWVSPTYICAIVSGTPVIQEPEKCSELRWVSVEEAEQLPLSVVTTQDVAKLKAKHQFAVKAASL
jgi:8-oxo-dGTP diphosphatase